jgi:hypothetical protein
MLLDIRPDLLVARNIIVRRLIVRYLPNDANRIRCSADSRVDGRTRSGFDFGSDRHKDAANQRRDHANQNHACGSPRIAFMAEDQLVARLV